MDVKVRFIAKTGALPRQSRDILVYLPDTFLSCFHLSFEDTPQLLGETLTEHWGDDGVKSALQSSTGYRVMIFTAETREEEEIRINEILSEIRKSVKWLCAKSVRKPFNEIVTVSVSDKMENIQ